MDETTIDIKSNLPGTVGYYQKHLIICSGRSDWEARIQDEGGIIKELVEILVENKEVKVTACDLPSVSDGVTLFLYPENIRIFGINKYNLEILKHYVLTGENKGLRVENITQKLILVCIHNKRDPRCGTYGESLIETIKTNLASFGLKNQVMVAGSSHLGGHKFAGVVLIYPSANWYGRITEKELPALIEAEIINNRPLSQNWRGRIKLTPEEQIQLASNQGWIILDENLGLNQ